MASPKAIVIFGASGDLTQRKLGPALHSLSCAGQLPTPTNVIGVGRTVLSDEAFRDRLYRGIEAYARLKPDPNLCNLWPTLGHRFSYLAGSIDDARTYTRLGQRIAALSEAPLEDTGVLYYLAVPPEAAETIVAGLATAGLHRSGHGWRRIVFEKPFGVDGEAAARLNRRVHDVFREPQVFRIDHYLGKETVQNILVLRLANGIFAPLWSREFVDHVQITLAESGGVGRRGATYDRMGVVRDVLQNHGLQLVALAMMEPPVSLAPEPLRDAKLAVLRAIRRPEPSDAVLGQYQGYRDEPDVDPGSDTPTYVAVRLHVNTWRWRGVPLYLRCGKQMAEKVTEITVQFKPTATPLTNALPPPNRLTLRLQPDEGIKLRIQTKVPGAGQRIRSTDLAFGYAEQFGPDAIPDAYERLLLDALEGDPTLFLRSDEIEAAWDVVEPLLRRETGADVPFPYSEGSWGPAEADALIERDGRSWLAGCAPTRRNA